MMTRKTRLMMIGAIVVVGLLLAVWLWLAFKPQTQRTAETSTKTTQTPHTSAPTAAELQQQQDQTERTQASGVTAVAKMFVERYGSYSNEARFQNLVDVLPLMTETFAGKTSAFIATATSPETFYGVTTRVITVRVETLDEQAGRATLLLNTQKEVAQGSTQNTSVSYQEIKLELLKEAGTWKIDSANWL